MALDSDAVYNMSRIEFSRFRFQEDAFMTKSITAHYDGQVLVPDEPLEVPIGKPLTIHVEVCELKEDRFSDLRALATELPEAPSDLSVQHDHYLYGDVKR